jgi:ATP-dependent DNA ligase
MAAEKRDMTNFYEFPGEINEATQTYEFPPLYHADDHGHIRVWHAYIRLVQEKNNNKSRVTEIDWNPGDETNVIDLDDKYFGTGEDYEDLPENVVVQMWSETGVTNMKITRGIPSYYEGIKNEGKKNQRNALHTALIEGRKDYLNKKRKGATEKIPKVTEKKSKKTKKTTEKEDRSDNSADESDNSEEKKSFKKSKKSNNINSTTHTTRYFPMLARKYAESKKYIKFPCAVQRKYDGVRCLAHYNPEEKQVDLYTRTRKDMPGKNYIKDILMGYLPLMMRDGSSLYLDGELYKHGLQLQKISGESRNDTEGESMQLEYHIYDCFYPNNLSMPYSERRILLEEFINSMTQADRNTIKLVETFTVQNQGEIDALFDRIVAEGYEGCIIRGLAAPYLTDANKTSTKLRSHYLVKLKARFSEEYPIFGYTQGKRGKDKGAIIWQCKAKKGKVFNVTPKNMTYEERKSIFEECDTQELFKEKYKGKPLTVEFEAMSKDGVPQRAKGIVIRDYE